MLEAAIEALPPRCRRKLMVARDGAGASHALITKLDELPSRRGCQLTYSRIEHTNRYVLTPDGLSRDFYTKLHNRLLRPLLAADQPQAPPNYAPRSEPSTSTYLHHVRLTTHLVKT